jgi:predicted ATPase/DNA-binding winged helix-turn-helix (wHTH) protein
LPACLVAPRRYEADPLRGCGIVVPGVGVSVEFAVGEFRVRPAERRVVLHGRPVALGARAFDLLLALIENRDRVVGKDELLALVWPAVVVEEGNLAVQVSTLRKLLGSDAITTVPGRGYRFTASVAEAGPQHADEQLTQKLRRPPNAQEPEACAASWVPAALTPLLGRVSALRETQDLLQATRCLTLTGAGGAGKTRLALALAEALQPGYPGGVWWVGLDKLNDPRMLAETIAHAVGVADPHKPPLQALVERLKARKALLVLDNCEHLVDDCAELAAHLLRDLPLLQLLATSRESLRIAGEVAWSVPPLQVPGAAGEERWDDLLQHASVQLLVQRIRQHNPEFALTQHNAASLVQICRGLEGLPLALELVAAQVGPQTLAQVALRLDRSLPMLSVGARGGVRHHQTMAAAVDWGYKLLGASQSALFLRLSVCAGGWTQEAAEAICKGQGIAVEQVPELLGHLQRVSMVLAGETGGVLRFRMLEPIRQFAFAKLEELGQTALVRGQLLAWYVEHCKALAALLAGPQQALGYRYLVAEFDNLRALLSWSRQGDLENGLRLAADLWRFWQVKGHAKEMLNWFEEALPLASAMPAPLRADAYNAAGVMARTCGLYATAVRLHDAALELQRELGNLRGEAVALNNLCVVARDQYDHPTVEKHGRASLQIAREIGDRNLEGLGLMHLGTALRGQDRFAQAETSFRQSFEIFSELGERRALAALLNFLGNLAQAGGRWPEAGRCFEEGLTLNQALDDFWGLGISTFNMASLRYAMADHAGALPLLMQSLAHYRRAGVKHGVEECFELLANIAQKLGRLERAAWCWGVVEHLEQDMGKVLPQALKALRLRTHGALQAAMPADLFLAAQASGRRDALEEAYLAVFPDGGLA